ncbi:hypothetical protein DR864_13435 [Runella rosea]|uniref:Uncharacterized protein n=1 Tax=Runella rosea TaxID=2259595 RepID=A0A344TJ63_9BACT|nr:hypothetical protein [Runella rosea]AXE18684.1 hypothetical protein DR864_13435 [Runella rosea]
MIIEEKDLALARCRALVEKKLNWGSSNDWSAQDFERLSERIAAETGVSLSATTLKRVWGKVKYDSVPTQTTLNALAQFLGYDNWRLFCVSNLTLNGNGNHTAEMATAVTQKVLTLPFWKRRRTWLIGLVLIVAVSAVAVLFFNYFNAPIDVSQVRFSSRRVSEGLPNSVVFEYSVGNLKTDSVTIQQSWDPRRRERISAYKGQHTSIYYYPGYFNAKLLIGDQIMQEHPVFIKTQGWKGIVEQSPLPIYLSNKEIGLTGNTMEIKAETLREKTSKAVFNDVWTHFYLVKDFNLNADNFTFETVLQNTSAKEEAICQKVRIRILTSESAIGLPLCSKGCTSDASLFIGGTNVSGKDRDLSAFGCDFSKVQRLKCTVSNKVFTVFLNGKSIFTAPANENLGKIVGVVIGFEGAGKIESAAFL